MVVEREIISFWDWLLPRPGDYGAFVTFLIVFSGLLILSLIVGYGISVFRNGFVEGFFSLAKLVADTVSDFLHTSPRRVLAMTRLSVHEAIRRKILIAFGLFVIVLLFASWFLDSKTDDPARLYIGFVLSWTNLLMLILAVMLSVFSLPNDIKFRTIYTIATKPVRPHEMVLGRVFGFTAVGTLILASMAVVSYGFVVRGLSHTHEIDPSEIEEVKDPTGKSQIKWKGRTELANRHRHEVTIGPDGLGTTDQTQDHQHAVQRIEENGKVRYVLGPQEGMLQARVPVYGKLTFIDRTGAPANRGINVGDEWAYRSFIEGDTTSRAIWSFSGVTPSRFPNGLPIEMTIEVFRTHKGNIERVIEGELLVRNPRTHQSAWHGFKSRDMEPNLISLTEFVSRDGKKLDLFEDLVDGGNLEVLVSCKERAQHFGMSQADLYLRAAEGSFFWNFMKGYITIWYQMVVVICFGVMFSTILSAPVALVSLKSKIVMAYSVGFVTKLASGQIEGGGPVEQMIRMFRQAGQAELEFHPYILKVIHAIDFVLVSILYILTSILPPFRGMDTSEFVASGYDIWPDLIYQYGLVTLVILCVTTLYSCAFLKSREIAA